MDRKLTYVFLFLISLRSQERCYFFTLVRLLHGLIDKLSYFLRVEILQKHAVLRETSRQSKITYFGITIGRDEDICRFDVSVHNISVMDESE